MDETALARLAKYADNPASIRATVRTDDLRELLKHFFALHLAAAGCGLPYACQESCPVVAIVIKSEEV